jgi:hypothetical protein
VQPRYTSQRIQLRLILSRLTSQPLDGTRQDDDVRHEEHRDNWRTRSIARWRSASISPWSAAGIAAYVIKGKHPWAVFTSGRRDPARQASAMAGNVVRNRRWIAQTYAANPVSAAAQAWVDDHPEARTQQAIADGLLSVFKQFSRSELGRLSYHLSGLAFDIQPVPAQESAVSTTIRSLPGLREFLTKEGGLTIWHVGF